MREEIPCTAVAVPGTVNMYEAPGVNGPVCSGVEHIHDSGRVINTAVSAYLQHAGSSRLGYIHRKSSTLQGKETQTKGPCEVIYPATCW